MNKLYALLIILIVAFVGINVACDNVLFIGHMGNSTSDANSTVVGNSSFTNATGYNVVSSNASSVVLSNGTNNISVEQFNYENNLASAVGNMYLNGGYTSNQTINQNGVTVYFLYQEGTESYNATVYFNKNSSTYLITSTDIPFENSDSVINSIKAIIDSMGPQS